MSTERDLFFRSNHSEIASLRDLVAEPAWESGDLGFPLPDSPHACSVCLPTWESVIGYEEERDKVLRKLRAGYPRFFLNPHVKALNDEAEASVGRTGERVMVFPHQRVGPTSTAICRKTVFVSVAYCQLRGLTSARSERGSLPRSFALLAL